MTGTIIRLPSLIIKRHCRLQLPNYTRKATEFRCTFTMAEGESKPRVALVTGITGQVGWILAYSIGSNLYFLSPSSRHFVLNRFFSVQDGSYLAELLLSKGYKVGRSRYARRTGTCSGIPRLILCCARSPLAHSNKHALGHLKVSTYMTFSYPCRGAAHLAAFLLGCRLVLITPQCYLCVR